MSIRILAMPVVGAIVAAAACIDRPYDGRMRGEWTVSMTLRSALPGRSVTPGTTVAGSITVPDPTPVNPRAFPAATPADVKLDLRPFGLRISPRKQPAVADQGDRTVRLDLGSTPNELVLVGTLAGDSVKGVWYDEFRSGGAVGEFVMRRTHPRP